jgi:hypothetical protein
MGGSTDTGAEKRRDMPGFGVTVHEDFAIGAAGSFQPISKFVR